MPDTPAPVWLTTAQAAERATQWRRIVSGDPTATISPATIRKWASRGHLTATGLDDRGRPLYTLGDVAAAEKKTRARALRLVGISQAA